MYTQHCSRKLPGMVWPIANSWSKSDKIYTLAALWCSFMTSREYIIQVTVLAAKHKNKASVVLLGWKWFLRLNAYKAAKIAMPHSCYRAYPSASRLPVSPSCQSLDRLRKWLLSNKNYSRTHIVCSCLLEFLVHMCTPPRGLEIYKHATWGHMRPSGSAYKLPTNPSRCNNCFISRWKGRATTWVTPLLCWSKAHP